MDDQLKKELKEIKDDIRQLQKSLQNLRDSHNGFIDYVNDWTGKASNRLKAIEDKLDNK